MEPPEGARLEGGWWKYRPDLPPQREVTLARSWVVADYEVRVAGEGWRALGSLLPGIADDMGVTVAAWP
jgi:hypothetical protein